MTTTHGTIDNNDLRTLTIFHTPHDVGGYRTFLVWEPMRQHWAIDVVLVDGKTYHCHPSVKGSQLEEFKSHGHTLSELLFGEDRTDITVSPVRWADNHIDFERWAGLYLPEFINVEIRHARA